MNCTHFVCLFAITSCLGDRLPSGSWLGDCKDIAEIDAYAERPCARFNLDCIRRYFTENSNCRLANGRVADPFFIEQWSFQLANANLTLVGYNTTVTGLNGRITEFTINNITNSLVMAMETTNTEFFSRSLDIRYHRLMREPVVRTDVFMALYASVTFTITFPDMNNLDLRDIGIFPYVASPPTYQFGPNVIRTYDITAIRSFNAMVSNAETGAKEAYFNWASLFVVEFVQKTICDFGVVLE